MEIHKTIRTKKGIIGIDSGIGIMKINITFKSKYLTQKYLIQDFIKNL